ncbi:MAG: response regulator [Spirochaetia bacterium]|nr:response regulator [Spirochaetia bacterium]
MNDKILIIDDSHSMAKSMELMLRKFKFQVECAFNGKSGVERIKIFKPDLIFLDIEMPGWNGFETLIEIKKLMNRNYTSHVIMVSGHHSHDDVIKAMQNGAQDYIVKPFDEELLKEKLKKYLKF